MRSCKWHGLIVVLALFLLSAETLGFARSIKCSCGSAEIPLGAKQKGYLALAFCGKSSSLISCSVPGGAAAGDRTQDAMRGFDTAWVWIRAHPTTVEEFAKHLRSLTGWAVEVEEGLGLALLKKQRVQTTEVGLRHKGLRLRDGRRLLVVTYPTERRFSLELSDGA